MTDPRNIVNDPAPVPTTPAHAVEVPKKDHLLTNEIYNVVKFVAQTLLPAVGTLYFTLSGLWGLPNTEQVIGSVTAVDLFLGVILGISTVSFNKSDSKFDGTINVALDPDSGKKTFSLELDSSPEDLEHKDQVTFDINPVVHE